MAPTRIGRPALHILPISKSITRRSSVYASSPLSSVTSSTRSFESSPLSGSSSESGFFSPHTSYSTSPTSASPFGSYPDLKATMERTPTLASLQMKRRKSSTLHQMALHNAHQSQVTLTGTTAQGTPSRGKLHQPLDVEKVNKRLSQHSGALEQLGKETAVETVADEGDSIFSRIDNSDKSSYQTVNSSVTCFEPFDGSEFPFRPNEPTQPAWPPPSLGKRLSRRWKTFTRKRKPIQKNTPPSIEKEIIVSSQDISRSSIEKKAQGKLSEDLQKEILFDGACIEKELQKEILCDTVSLEKELQEDTHPDNVSAFSDSSLEEGAGKKLVRTASQAINNLSRNSTFKIPLKRVQTLSDAIMVKLGGTQKPKQNDFFRGTAFDQNKDPSSKKKLYTHSFAAKFRIKTKENITPSPPPHSIHDTVLGSRHNSLDEGIGSPSPIPGLPIDASLTGIHYAVPWEYSSDPIVDFHQKLDLITNFWDPAERYKPYATIPPHINALLRDCDTFFAGGDTLALVRPFINPNVSTLNSLYVTNSTDNLTLLKIG